VIPGLTVSGQQLVKQNNAQITSQRTNAQVNAHGKVPNAKRLLRLVQICLLKKVVQTWLDVDGNLMHALASQHAKILLLVRQRDAMSLLEAKERNVNLKKLLLQ